jgi:hypothetical protein
MIIRIILTTEGCWTVETASKNRFLARRCRKLDYQEQAEEELRKKVQEETKHIEEESRRKEIADELYKIHIEFPDDGTDLYTPPQEKEEDTRNIIEAELQKIREEFLDDENILYTPPQDK